MLLTLFFITQPIVTLDFLKAILAMNRLTLGWTGEDPDSHYTYSQQAYTLNAYERLSLHYTITHYFFFLFIYLIKKMYCKGKCPCLPRPFSITACV